jgi:hypothetical protein
LGNREGEQDNDIDQLQSFTTATKEQPTLKDKKHTKE